MSTDSRSGGFGRAIQSATRACRSTAILATARSSPSRRPGNTVRRPRAGCRRRWRPPLEPSILAAAGLALREHHRIVLVHGEQALATPAEPSTATRIGTRGSPFPSSRMRRSANTAARRVSAPSSREITAAMSRAVTPSAFKRPGDVRKLGPARPSACVSSAWSISSPRIIASPRAQAQQVACVTTATTPRLVFDAEVADLARLMRPIARYTNSSAGTPISGWLVTGSIGRASAATPCATIARSTSRSVTMPVSRELRSAVRHIGATNNDEIVSLTRRASYPTGASAAMNCGGARMMPRCGDGKDSCRSAP